jgi:hypothetical protein
LWCWYFATTAIIENIETFRVVRAGQYLWPYLPTLNFTANGVRAPGIMSDLQTYRKLLWIIIFAAFAVRVAVRCYSGAEDFWVNGYGLFFGLAQNIAAGNA